MVTYITLYTRNYGSKQRKLTMTVKKMFSLLRINLVIRTRTCMDETLKQKFPQSPN